MSLRKLRSLNRTGSIFNAGLHWWLSGKEFACNAGDARDEASISESGRSLEEEMATHSSILDGKIPRTEEPGGLQSTGVTKELDTIDVTEHTHTNTHTVFNDFF